MKRMTTAKKTQANRLTAKRTRKDLKRRPHIKALKLAGYKINMYRKQVEKLMYLRKKYGTKETPPQTAPLI
jgi:hypothetical protein